MIDNVYSVIFAFVTFQYSVVHHAQRQRRSVVRLVVEIRRDLLFAENGTHYVLLCKRRYVFLGLRSTNKNGVEFYYGQGSRYFIV